MSEGNEHRRPGAAAEFLDGLYDNVLYRLSEFVGRPLRLPSTTVRGVVRPNPRTARVFLLPDSDFASSFAADVPLVDSEDRQYSPDTVTALLRAITDGEYIRSLPSSEIVVGATSIKLFDTRTAIDSVVESDSFEDYVRVTLFNLVGSRRLTGGNTEEERKFAGFLILNESTVRYYFSIRGSRTTIGIDCPLRTRSNRKRRGGATFLPIKIKELFDTGVMDGLLVPESRDDYCQAVYDATAHL
ncbi:MAG TPA: hypothetical protein VF444_17690 [Pseudonocardiaceae bacterium]